MEIRLIAESDIGNWRCTPCAIRGDSRYGFILFSPVVLCKDCFKEAALELKRALNLTGINFS